MERVLLRCEEVNLYSLCGRMELNLACLEELLGSQDVGGVEHAMGWSWCLWEAAINFYRGVSTLADAKVLQLWVAFWCPHFR
jgi:hypothetical protein